MGGSSKKQTVGYKYYLGMHMVLCHGPIDNISEIRVDDRLAWRGFSAGGALSINKPSLFGGEKREGGVQGTVDLLMGETTQTKNSYLQSRLGNDIPAFRGVVSMVLRQVYVGMNPYLKRWSFRAQRTNLRNGGEEQWYVEKAPIGSLSNAAIYIALDLSTSMGGSRIASLKSAMSTALSPLLGLPSNSSVDFMVVGFAGSTTSITRRGASGEDVQEIIDWTDDLDFGDVSQSSTDFDVAMSPSVAFFSGSSSNKDFITLFCTDGDPFVGGNTPAEKLANAEAAQATLNTTPGVIAWAFNIDQPDTTYTAYLDNTNSDGVPNVDGTDPKEFVEVITRSVFSHFDLNPAHIIRECLTDLDWGMGYAEADIDDDSFGVAADQLYEEQMGVSLLWDRQTSIESFVNEIVKHIDAALYVDRSSGKFKLVLIRDDYNEESLVVLDESNIDKLENLNRPTFGELTNSVTVNYWDATTREDASITVQDTAMVQMTNSVINTTLQYPGFTNAQLASRVAMRDLKTLSSPLWSATIFTGQIAKDFTIGSVFKLSWSEYGISDVVMRVTGIAYGDGKNNQIRIQATQDQFALQAGTAVAPPDPDDVWVPLDTTPAPSPVRLVTETPYYELVTQLGQTDLDNLLLGENDLGYLFVAGGRPEAEGITNAQVYVDSGSGFEDSAVMDFSPFAYLDGDVSDITETIFPVTGGVDLDLVETGTLAQIGSEIVRVDAVSSTELTLGRGVLDTVPIPHSDGNSILFWDGFPVSDEVEYVASESLDVKIAPASGDSELELSAAPTDTVDFASRAIRPYPVADVKFEGVYAPEGEFSEIEVTWVYRNRLQQTSGTFVDYFDGEVTKEEGTTVGIRIYNDSDGLVTTKTGLTGNSYTIPGGELPSTGTTARIQVFSERDGYESWTYTEQTILLPSGIAGDELDFIVDTGYTAPDGDAIDFIVE